MVIDWDRGTVDFSKKKPAVGFSAVQLLIALPLIPLGLFFGGNMVISIFHEIGHAIAVHITGSAMEVHWDYITYWGGNVFFIRIAGPFGGLFIWTGFALLSTRRLPGISAFFISYAVAETFACAVQVHTNMSDLQSMPIAAGVLLLCMVICVIIYFIKLTGGRFFNLTKGN